MYFLQFILLVSFCAYDTHLIFYRSYYLMNNEAYDKIRYSNLLCLVIIQILVFFMKPEEIFQTPFITIFICIIIFITILVFMSYDPYSYIIIDVAETPENLYYYFFLLDRNKNISFYLDDKIKQHISVCNCCSLCLKYQKYYENYNVIEIVNDNDNNNNDKNNNDKNIKDKNINDKNNNGNNKDNNNKEEEKKNPENNNDNNNIDNNNNKDNNEKNENNEKNNNNENNDNNNNENNEENYLNDSQFIHRAIRFNKELS